MSLPSAENIAAMVPALPSSARLMALSILLFEGTSCPCRASSKIDLGTVDQGFTHNPGSPETSPTPSDSSLGDPPNA